MGRKRGKGEERCKFYCTRRHAAFKPVNPPYFSQAVCSTFNLSVLCRFISYRVVRFFMMQWKKVFVVCHLTNRVNTSSLRKRN